MRFFFLTISSVLLNGSLASGLANPEEVPKARLAKFRAEVEPVLKRVCVGCHGMEKQKGKFRVDTLNPDLLKGKEGRQLVAGGVRRDQQCRDAAGGCQGAAHGR